MKSHKQLGLTKSQYKNIAKLTIFVRDSVPPPKFNIKVFYLAEDGGGETPKTATYDCGTSACFCGYGPLAGIRGKKEEGWVGYAKRVFGAEVFGAEGKYDLLFDDKHKNSKTAAIKRAAYFLENGFPESDDFRRWETPRSFKPDWESIEAIANS